MNPRLIPYAAGIGAQVAKQYLSRTGLQVVALSRDASRAKNAILSGDSKLDESRLHTISLDIKSEGGRFLIKHTDNQCLITYSVNLQDNRLVGDYTIENCTGPRRRGERGKFLAIRFSQPADASTPAP